MYILTIKTNSRNYGDYQRLFFNHNFVFKNCRNFLAKKNQNSIAGLQNLLEFYIFDVSSCISIMKIYRYLNL